MLRYLVLVLIMHVDMNDELNDDCHVCIVHICTYSIGCTSGTDPALTICNQLI